jgi:hypothetical protein
MLPEKVLDTGKYKNEQRAKTPKLGKAELCFCTALLFNEIYISIYKVS